MATAIGITLKRYKATEVQYRAGGAVRLKIVAENPVGMDSSIFLFLRGPMNPETQQETDTFHTIASPSDMSLYPAEDPSRETTYPFFRSNYVELDFPSLHTAEQAWNDIVDATTVLVNGLKKLENLKVDATITIGDIAPLTPNSISASI